MKTSLEQLKQIMFPVYSLHISLSAHIPQLLLPRSWMALLVSFSFPLYFCFILRNLIVILWICIFSMYIFLMLVTTLVNSAEGFIAGGTAGVVVETALYPIDTIKTRLQAGQLSTWILIDMNGRFPYLLLVS